MGGRRRLSAEPRSLVQCLRDAPGYPPYWEVDMGDEHRAFPPSRKASTSGRLRPASPFALGLSKG